MEVGGSSGDLEKKIVDLEAKCEWWEEEKIKLEGRVLKAKGGEERMKKKHMKWKRKYAEMRAEYDSEKMRWWEEDDRNRERYWQVEVEKRKLVVDLKAAWSQLRGTDEGAVQLRETDAEVELLKRLLEERDGQIAMLWRKIETLDGQNHSFKEGQKMIVEREAQNRQLEMEKTKVGLKREEDVEFAHQAPAVGILGSPASHNQGKKSSDVSYNKSQKDGSSIVLGCSIQKQIGTNQCESGEHSVAKLKWENQLRMFNAFTTNDVLCMESVCALYRKHNSLGPWKNKLSSSDREFKIEATKYDFPSNFLSFRGTDLGEFLTRGDPEGKMTKLVDELKRAIPDGIAGCRLIARMHYKELFQIYKDNLDPLFNPDETI